METEMSEIAFVIKALSRGYFLIMDCGHWYRWGTARGNDASGAKVPEVGSEFPCPECRRAIAVVPIPAPPTRTEEPSKLSDYHFELLEGGDDRGEVGLRDVAMKAARRLAFLEAEREKQTIQILGHEQSYKMLRTQLDEHVTDVSRLREQIETMRELLRELYAMVQGECPSLLREDSGGNGELSLRIDAALFPPERP